ncbi:MAG: hypothetical protein E2O39_11800 [Planctomycetota bacterium]|nr:MAG: hypothetical protein E2O39_11800 [Planctomycetota bacterium]
MSINHAYDDIHIETTLPKAWEQEETFNDVLYDWMSRAPWLAISAAAHLVIFLIIQAVPWALFSNEDPTEIQARLDVPPEIFEDPPEEIEEEIEEEEVEEEPIVQDFEISDHNEEDVDEDYESVEGDPDMFSDSPFDDKAFNDVIGIGGGAGGKFGGRFGGRRNLRAAGGSGTQQALKDGLEWLKHHQSPDGSWDSDNFMQNCGKIGSDVCENGGEALHDVGLTGLALLAFLGDGNTMRRGPYKEVVTRGIKWLREQQDYETGLFGEEIGHAFLYNHGIAALAVCEAYYFSKSPLIRSTAQKSLNYIMRARNPYGAWRYDVPPVGDNDTSMTGWMVFALTSGEDAGLLVEQDAFVGALQWIDEVTDPANGRVGYDSEGSMSSRVIGINDHFPPEKAEAMTSVALLCRFFLGQDPKDESIMAKHADLMLKSLPVWDPEKYGCDMYYWYYGTYAMYQMGGKWWKGWNVSMKKAVLESQVKTGDAKGSWDPLGPWGHYGGRVYSTALSVLCLEVYFRYARVLGAR